MDKISRNTTYFFCVAGFVWLGVGNLQFRQSIRTTRSEAYASLNQLDPDAADRAGKILNSYYESVYDNLPPTLLPGSILMLGATLLLLAGNRNDHKPRKQAVVVIPHSAASSRTKS